jgi:hypothetical protein
MRYSPVCDVLSEHVSWLDVRKSKRERRVPLPWQEGAMTCRQL